MGSLPGMVAVLALLVLMFSLTLIRFFPRRCAQVHRVCSKDNFLGYELIVLPEFVAIHQENFCSARKRAFCFEPVLSPVFSPGNLAVGVLLIKGVVCI